jgi:exopolyphosphatase/guanosine-5'-triphosphate,3'-diphosphate pyrophosphatase
MFIHGKNHEAHGAYIINNSEIFGLTREEKRVVERMALYHRGHPIPQQDKDFTVLSRQERILILKLTSILRVADALDRSHKQEIRDFTLEFRKDVLAIKCKVRSPIERMAVAEKADMFESVFGYRVVLE